MADTWSQRPARLRVSLHGSGPVPTHRVASVRPGVARMVCGVVTDPANLEAGDGVTCARCARSEPVAPPGLLGSVVGTPGARSVAHVVAALQGPAGRKRKGWVWWVRTACGKTLRSDLVDAKRSVTCTRCRVAEMTEVADG